MVKFVEDITLLIAIKNGEIIMIFIMKLFRLVVTVAMVGISIYLVYDFAQKEKVRSEYNGVIEMINRGELISAVPKLKVLIKSKDLAVAENAEHELVKLYKRLGDDTGRPTKESAEYYKLALRIDPSCLNEKQKQLVEADRKFSESAKKLDTK